MTRFLLFALALLQVPALPDTESAFSRYLRPIPIAAPGQTCVVLDAPTMSHAAPFLKDLRLYATGPSGVHEVPYVLTLSEAQQTESEPARILNLTTRAHAVVFDLAMPNRPYTDVILDLSGQDFVATASVTGTTVPGSPDGTRLGDFNLFDLTSRHLSRSTSLHLQESSFPFLHISLIALLGGRDGSFVATAQMIRGATVPPSREAQTLFTVATQTSIVEQQGRNTVARFSLPARVPIERVSFVLDPGFRANFSRDVLVSSHAPGAPSTSGESATGTIQRVTLTSPRDIREERLSLPATLGANLQNTAEVEVIVHNSDDSPLPIRSVGLEMRQRDLCFQAPASQPGTAQQLTLFYGDSRLPAPAYDLVRTYTPSAHSAIARLGPEELNPAWRPRPDVRPYTQRHPHLLWIALLIFICTFALVAFRSSHPRRHHPHR